MATDPARAAIPFPVGAQVHHELEAWLRGLKLLPHQRPIAATALRLALIIDDPDAFTAAAVEQLRRTLLQLTPPDALKHQSQTNLERIKKRPAAKPKATGAKKSAAKRAPQVDDSADTQPRNKGSRTRKRREDAGLSPAQMAERIRTGRPRAAT
jgi:hypothetical protein